MFCTTFDRQYGKAFLEGSYPFSFNCDELMEGLDFQYSNLLAESTDDKVARLSSSARELEKLKKELNAIKNTKRYTDIFELIGKIITVIFGIFVVLQLLPLILMVSSFSIVSGIITSVLAFVTSVALPLIAIKGIKVVMYKYIGNRLERLYDSASELEDDITDGATRATITRIKTDVNNMIMRIR